MMKVGDLVGYNREKIPSSVPPSDFNRLGLVVQVSIYQSSVLVEPPFADLPMALVQWNGIAGPLRHRQDLLKVLSENR